MPTQDEKDLTYCQDCRFFQIISNYANNFVPTAGCFLLGLFRPQKCKEGCTSKTV